LLARFYSVYAVLRASVIYTYVSVSMLDALMTDEIRRQCHLLVTSLSHRCETVSAPRQYPYLAPGQLLIA